MLTMTTYTCRDCGNLFIHKMGGFILLPSAPHCPKYGSRNVKKE